MPCEARLEIFLKKYLKNCPKIHCLAIKLYTGPPNCITGAFKSGDQGGRAPGAPLDPLVIFMQFSGKIGQVIGWAPLAVSAPSWIHRW